MEAAVLDPDQDSVDMARVAVAPSTSRATTRATLRAPTPLFALIALAAFAVPLAFTPRIQAAFVVPKLGVLWGLLAAVLGVAALQALLGSLPKLRPHWVVDAAVLTFLGLTVLASIVSTDGTQSLYGERLQHQGLLTTALYVGWFYIARLAVRSIEDLRRLLAATASGGALVAAYALVQKVGLDPVWDGFLPGGRVFSSIGQANALAAYVVLVLPLAASFVFDTRRVVKFAALVVSSALLLAFVFAQSRGGYIGLLSAAVVVAVGWKDELRLRRRSVVWAVVVVAIATALAGRGELDRLASVGDASARFHRDAWTVAAEIAKDHPLLGTGPETFPDVLPEYSHEVLPSERASALDAFRVESPHNVYLGVAAGSGLPALLAYLVAIGGSAAVLVTTMRVSARRVRLVLAAVLGALAGHLVTDAFMSPEVTTTWLAWILLGGSLGTIGATRPVAEEAQASV